MRKEAESMADKDLIVMLYFPKMLSGDDKEDTDLIQSCYTPFLMELYPRSNKIKLYYKSLVASDEHEEIHDNHEKKLEKLSILCVDLM